jgi:hypothetical protein
MKEPGLTTGIMKSQLSRLYGQLYTFQVRHVRGGCEHSARVRLGSCAARRARLITPSCAGTIFGRGPGMSGYVSWSRALRVHVMRVP